MSLPRNAILANVVNSFRTYQPLSVETVMELVASAWPATSKPCLHTHTRTCRKGGQFGFEKEKFIFSFSFGMVWALTHDVGEPIYTSTVLTFGERSACVVIICQSLLAECVTQESRSALSVNSHNIAKENIREKTKLKVFEFKFWLLSVNWSWNFQLL